MTALRFNRRRDSASLPSHGTGSRAATRAIGFFLAWLLLPLFARAAETIPPAPPNHFNDFAGLVSRDTAAQLNRELAQFERDTSSQIVVAIYPRMQSDSSVEDYTVRVAQRWGVGQKERKNGAVLFVFQQSHDVRIVTGYGLEGALPDALCKQIIENEIIPRFRAGDFSGGIASGVRAMMAATRGEYRGTGRTAAQSGRAAPRGGLAGLLPFLFIVILLAVFSRRARRGMVYGPRGRRGIWMGGAGPWGGGGGWGGGSSGGGTFSGGGGSFGGGGAGGRW